MSEQDDRSRFEAVYRRTYEQILGYAVRRCSSPEDAADVVSETYATAWRRMTELPEGEAAKLWLYGVARRVLANHRRSERRRLTRHAELTEEIEQLYPAPSAPRAHDGVAEAMDLLADSDRELLALALWEELDPGEIAAVLDCSRNAARIRLHRARKRFAKALEKTHPSAAGFATARPLIEKESR
ncbi:RNA polymerase sigma factor [Nonomuraea gerenzanensis]|uniref:Putative RNA polymerase ECF-subfamily sigma factor n=1 Tax=Nonomuraea gerenzanensis TaxID=93944 RepID=A0A1M4EJB9_9ACTN|nr:RNA polymerase sigma factor [Nonomuraea gerenzanensis]UBU10289.1 RNA polymerase sigma factor [Nonomuraea gerenzanensis]SBO98673.1 putative RNA polymerase ECF-subfamily sigma factor [Nonomuraea gerenzanensis]